jgi:ATP/maltotriose-dependent transcriptional regulator MalT
MIDMPEFSQPALCAEVGGDDWYPEYESDNGAAAKRVCRACPARAECLEWALRNDERYGIWGGLSTGQRHKIMVNAGRAGKTSPRDPKVSAHRRAEVLRLTADGWSIPRIAEFLKVSESVVKYHRQMAAKTSK